MAVNYKNLAEDLGADLNRNLRQLELTGVSFQWTGSEIEDIDGNEDECGSQSTALDLTDTINQVISGFYQEATGTPFRFTNGQVVFDWPIM